MLIFCIQKSERILIPFPEIKNAEHEVGQGKEN